jgi:hypothetical protein
MDNIRNINTISTKEAAKLRSARRNGKIKKTIKLPLEDLAGVVSTFSPNNVNTKWKAP